MSLPYRSEHAGRLMMQSTDGHAANAGLVFDKFFSGWNDSFTDLADNKNFKRNWVGQMVQRHKTRHGVEPGIEREMAERQRLLATALGGRFWHVEATGRFVTGTGLANPLENGFAWHHTGSFPYLPASGLKGALRSFWTQWTEDPGLQENATSWLGKQDGGTAAGTLIIFDMVPVDFTPLAEEVMTPHYGEWYQARDDQAATNAPGDWMDPVPIPFLAVEAGARFQIAMAPRGREEPDWQVIRKGVSDALTWIGLGAKTAVGYGRFELLPS